MSYPMQFKGYERAPTESPARLVGDPQQNRTIMRQQRVGVCSVAEAYGCRDGQELIPACSTGAAESAQEGCFASQL
jgi:hypothetical protein